MIKNKQTNKQVPSSSGLMKDLLTCREKQTQDKNVLGTKPKARTWVTLWGWAKTKAQPPPWQPGLLPKAHVGVIPVSYASSGMVLPTQMVTSVIMGP